MRQRAWTEEGPGGVLSTPTTPSPQNEGVQIACTRFADLPINQTAVLPFPQGSRPTPGLPCLPTPLDSTCGVEENSHPSGEGRGAETAPLLRGALPSLSSAKKGSALVSLSLPLSPALPPGLRRVRPHHSGGKRVGQGTPGTLEQPTGRRGAKMRFGLVASTSWLCRVSRVDVGTAQHKFNEFGELGGRSKVHYEAAP